MQLIKDKRLTENNWHYCADEDSLVAGNITVSFARWQKDHAQLQQHSGKVGIRVTVADDFEAINKVLNQLPLIELNFAAFTDGRLFSRAQLLRRAGFAGELRAVGQFMLDQIFYLSQVGVNAFYLENPAQAGVALTALDDFSSSYQL